MRKSNFGVSWQNWRVASAGIGYSERRPAGLPGRASPAPTKPQGCIVELMLLFIRADASRAQGRLQQEQSVELEVWILPVLEGRFAIEGISPIVHTARANACAERIKEEETRGLRSGRYQTEDGGKQ